MKIMLVIALTTVVVLYTSTATEGADAATPGTKETRQGVSSRVRHALKCLLFKLKGLIKGKGALKCSTETPQDVKQGLQDVKQASQSAKEATQDVKQAPQSAKQAPQSAKDAPQSAKQAPQDVKQAPQDVKQAPQGAKQVFQDIKLAPQSAKQAPQDAKQVFQDIKLAPQSAKQAPQGAKQVFQDIKLAPQGAKQALQNIKLAPQNAKGTTQDSHPGRDCRDPGGIPDDACSLPIPSLVLFSTKVFVSGWNCGRKVDAEDVSLEPRVKWSNADRNDLYTLLLISCAEFFVWGVVNIPGSVLLESGKIEDYHQLMDYEYLPVYPFGGEAKDCYYKAILYRQTRDIPESVAITEDERLPFDAKEFAQEHGLCGPLSGVQAWVRAETLD